MFRLAQISDIHLGPIPKPTWRQLMSKRAIGYTNWRRNRARAMTAETLNRLVDDMEAQAPDHIAVTGDLTNIALLKEFVAARRWLDELGEPDRVTVIPGNHDAYVPNAGRRFRRLWAPYMLGDDAVRVDEALFPFMRRKGDVAIIGVSSAVASAPFMATGRVGSGQTDRLRILLEQAREEDLFRVVLIHHPPKLIDPRSTWRRLTDGKRFRAMIEETGAELIVHGHEHIRSMTAIPGPRGPIPVVGVPAGSGPAIGGPRAGGYAIHEIGGCKRGCEVTVIHRGYNSAGEIEETVRSSYTIAR
ncbi:3',5'-cyclic AMP phosphodiesterase CpdA [Faunimonas pinastri]|uniref:3',5'-cyclic AMP phosphodiesterase CpdA n=1 Tax=Faunimonas pinastri TaxID=1855383 RepID=A0A1H9AD44_9HYPH|nr:metallophosphoesterase [Faunimonas pinastri]SEP74461.1 3',5'-cyclic AMP phosphodiesterase CpdA [Faunimonas pinastri]